jgi:hypothetical protein
MMMKRSMNQSLFSSLGESDGRSAAIGEPASEEKGNKQKVESLARIKFMSG